MTYPLKKETDELTTADIAQQNRTETSTEEVQINRPRLVPSERSITSERSFNDPDTGTSAISSEENRFIGRDDSSIAQDATTGRDETKTTLQSEVQATSLFPESELPELRRNWDRIQTAFVDEPRSAVQQADSLVASTMKRLAEIFAQERSKLENQWSRGDNVSTEDLRLALQRYRTFFQRLLAI